MPPAMASIRKQKKTSSRPSCIHFGEGDRSLVRGETSVCSFSGDGCGVGCEGCEGFCLGSLTSFIACRSLLARLLAGELSSSLMQNFVMVEGRKLYRLLPGVVWGVVWDVVCNTVVVFVVVLLMTVSRGAVEITRLRETVCFLGLRLGVSATSSSSLDTMVFDCALAGEGVAYKHTYTTWYTSSLGHL